MGKQRKRDAGWDHAIKVDESRFKTKCKWCGHVMSNGGVTRLKIHLAGVGGNATDCTECPNEVRLAMKELVRGVQTSCSKSKPKTAEPNFDHNFDAAQLPDGNSIIDDERGEFKMPACQTPEAINSNNQGSRMRVAYQGAPGAYSEEVAGKAYANCEAIPYEQFQSAFDAFVQCENVRMKLGVSRETVDDTAIAAQVLLPVRAAELYGLNILAHDIQDEPDNITRFLMLAREPVVSSTDGPFQPAYMEETKAEAEWQLQQRLAEMLGVLFYLDFDASMADPIDQNALRNLKEFATSVRGSYPNWVQ